MQNNKLIRLLSLLTKAQLEQLLLFLKSPYFNTNQHLTLLLEYLMPFAPGFKHPELSYQCAYTYVFKTDALIEDAKHAIIKLSSKVSKLAEQYIAHESLREHPFEAALFRKKWFQKLRNPLWENEALSDMKTEHVKYPLRNEYWANCSYIIDYEETKLVASSKLIAEKFDLTRLNTSLDAYYLRAKLECLCHMTNHQLVAGQHYDMFEFVAVNELLQQRLTQLDPAVLIWKKALNLLRNPEDKAHYNPLKTAILEQGNYLSVTENQTIFLYLTHAARFAFPDQDEYFKEIMHLFQLQILAGCLLTDGYINPYVFLNVISVAIRQKEMEWAKVFYQDYENLLDPSSEHRQDILLLCKSILLFENQEFESSLNVLNAAHFRDIQSKLTERRLRLKIYLELGYHDTFLDQVNTFRKFLSVNRGIISEHHYEGNKAFIQAAYMIYKSRDEKGRDLKTLQKMIQEGGALPEKHWIEGKLSA